MGDDRARDKGCPPHIPVVGGTAAFEWAGGAPGPEGGHWLLVENHCASGFVPEPPDNPGTGSECRRTQCVLPPAPP